jgi:hypothetical protein
MKLTPFGYYWLVWGILGFALPEFYWLAVNTKNTLSREWWALEQLDFGHPFDFAEWTPLHYVLGIIMLLFNVWLFLHLIFGILR